MTEPFRGVFTIPYTPFHESQVVDWAGLRRVVDFCVACGAHGIVWPVNASQFATLTDEERLLGMQIVTEQVGGRVPVVLGTQGVSAVHAAFLSRHAQAVGADAVMAMAPYVQPLGNESSIVHYYQAIDAEVEMPIFIQNHTRGSVLSVNTLARLVDEVEHVEYIKEETFPVTHMITQVLEACGPKLKGVFGGAGGRYLLLEHPRGVAGQMPGCHITDVVVCLWDALEAGDRAEAKRVFGMMGPIFALEMLKGSTYGEVLRRRGVIKFSGDRAGGEHLHDEYDAVALDEILADLEELFTWTGNGPLRTSGIDSPTSTLMFSNTVVGGDNVDPFDR
jgi:4-hydroxy-tetrahydrodipicolinate synthase